MSDWGTTGIQSFCTYHSTIYPSIDPFLIPQRFPPNYTVLVLGASRGIGASIATAYAAAGAENIILSSRRITSLKEVAEQCRKFNLAAKVEAFACDITKAEDVENLRDSVQNKFGRLDNVIINSGWSGPVNIKVQDDDPEMVKMVTEVNYLGTYYAAHYLIPLLLSYPPINSTVGKAFLVVGSLAALLVRGPIANTQYCLSKLAQLKLTEHIHEQYKDQGLLVAAVHPGAVATEMAADTCPAEFLEHLVDEVGLCGGFMVWLTRPREEGDDVGWLGGRQLVAGWNVEELIGLGEEVVGKGLLKVGLRL